MKYTTISLIYWAITVSAVIGVGVQHDLWWLIFASIIYVIAVIGTYVSIKLKK